MKKYILISIVAIVMVAGVLFAAPKYYVDGSGVVHSQGVTVDGTISGTHLIGEGSGISGIALPGIDIAAYGSVALADAAAIAAGKGLVCSTTVTISSAVTITSSVNAVPGCSFVKSGTGTLHQVGFFSAGLYTVFVGFSVGDVTFGSGSVKEAYPEWFGATGDYLNTDDTVAVQTVFGSGVKHIVFQKKYQVTDTIYSYDGQNITGTSVDTGLYASGTDFDVLDIASDADYLKLKNFSVTRNSASTTNDGIVLNSMNNHVLMEQVTGSNHRRGVYGKYSQWLVTIVQGRWDYCTTGFYFNGQNIGGTGAGTTILMLQPYTSWSGSLGYFNAIKEVTLVQPTMDHITNDGITFNSCATSNIISLHSEASTLSNYKGVVKVSGAGSFVLNLSGLNLENTSAAVDAYTILIDQPATTFRSHITGMHGETLTNIKTYAITDRTSSTAYYQFIANDFSGFVAGYSSLSGGKVRNFDTEIPATILNSIASTPTYTGQIAITGGNAYISTGVTGTSDWKQINN